MNHQFKFSKDNSRIQSAQASMIQRLKPLNQEEFHGLSPRLKEFNLLKSRIKHSAQAATNSKLCSLFILSSHLLVLPAKLSEAEIRGKATFLEVKWNLNKKSNSRELLKILLKVECYQKRLQHQHKLETAIHLTMIQSSILMTRPQDQALMKFIPQTQK